MAITKGAKKAHRASLKKQVFNVRRKRSMKDATKKVEKTLTGADLALAYKAIDKAAKRGVIKKNTASRKKSRLARLLAKETTKK
jgi:small subunit ribosomal protein S20